MTNGSTDHRVIISYRVKRTVVYKCNSLAPCIIPNFHLQQWPTHGAKYVGPINIFKLFFFFPVEIDVTKFVDQNFMVTVAFRWSFAAMLSRVMDHPNIKELIQSEDNSFDVVMVESFFQEYTVALGHKFNAPVVNLAPAMIWVSISKWLHVPATYAYVPDCCVGITDRMGFVDRVKNTVVGLLETYAEDYIYVPRMKEIMDAHFRYAGWESRPALEQMLGDVSLTLMNAYHAVGVCRPYPPGVVEVGGMHVTGPKPLPPVMSSRVFQVFEREYFNVSRAIRILNTPTKTNRFIVTRFSDIFELKRTPAPPWQSTYEV